MKKSLYFLSMLALLASSAAVVIAEEEENRTPTIWGTPPSEVHEEEIYKFLPDAIDPDGDELIFTIENAPDWLIFKEENGWCRGVPDDRAQGLYENIIISVTDGEFTASLPPFSITVPDTVYRAHPPEFSRGVIENVTEEWQIVDLNEHFDSMVVVTTPNYSKTSMPLVTRIRNVTNETFEIKVQMPKGCCEVLNNGIEVTYMAIEEGFYNDYDHGIVMEAVKFTSTVTDYKNNWVGEQRVYQNGYTKPVVLGQVMSFNDEDFSTFWSRGGNRQQAPTSESFYVGKMIGEDNDQTREDETIGYIVIEEGTYDVNGLSLSAYLGATEIDGVGDGGEYYTATGQLAVASIAGLRGNNGGWAVLNNNTAPNNRDQLRLMIDEDTIGDPERYHTTERVAYVMLEGVMNAPEEWINFEDYVDGENLPHYADGEVQNGHGLVRKKGEYIATTGNAWRKVDFDYVITANTVLEFDFYTSTIHPGEIIGIGFDNDNIASPEKIFQLYGTQLWGVLDFYDYVDGYKTYKIRVGDYYTGPMNALVFVNDDDENEFALAQFLRVKVYEE